MSNDALERLKKENEKLITINLFLDGQVQKINNQMMNFKNKIEKFEKNDNKEINIEKEIYIIEPTVAINQLNNELMTYRDVYSKLSENEYKLKIRINNFENTVSEQQTEITKLRNLLNELMYKTANDYTLSNYDKIVSPKLKTRNLSKDLIN